MANLFSIDNGKITYNKVSSNELNSITNKKKKLEELKNSYKNANQIVNNDIQKIGNYLNRNGQNVNKNNPFQANVVSNAMININKKNLNGRVTLQDVVQDHSNLLNSEKGQELKNNLRISKNERAWSEYNYNQEKVNNEETTLADKTIGTVTRGVKDLFSNMTDSRDIVDDKGKTTRLPSYNELKQNKVSQDYKTGIGKFLGDASYNISKIGASTLMNIPTLGVGGSAIYWSDMYFDSYNSAKNQGYSEDKAFSYALANTGFEYIVGKFLGSATKGLTGGQTSELSNAISNGVNKLISNPKIASIIGNAGSEATEEFIQEYLDNINKLVTLNGSKNPKDYIDVLLSKDILKDAFYSAGVGAVSGGLLQGINNKEGKYAQYNTNLLKSFKNQLEISKSNLTDKETIAKYDSVINDINDYISKPFGNESKVEKTLPTVYDIVAQENTKETEFSAGNTANNSITTTYESSVSNNNIQQQNESIEHVKKLKKISKWAFDKANRLKSFKEQIKDFRTNKLPTGTQLIVTDNSESLSYANLDNNPIVINQANIKKILQGKHSNIDTNIIENLDSELNNTVMALDSRTIKNAKVVVLNQTDLNGNPIIATIHQGKTSATIEVNELTSVYDKNEFQQFINNTIQDGKNIYTNEKTEEWLLRNRLQLPTRFTNNSVAMRKKPSTLTNSNAPSSTSKTKGSDISPTLIDNNIPQINENVKSGIPTTNDMKNIDIDTIKQTKGNIPINRELFKKYANTTELFADSKNNYNGEVEIKNNINEIENVDINNSKISEIKNIAKNIFEKYNEKNYFINDNNKIFVNKTGIDESITKIFESRQQRELLKEHLLVFSDLGDIIEHAKLVNQVPEAKGRSKYKSWNYYYDGLKINNELYNFEFEVVSMANGENHYRVQKLEKINNKKTEISTGSTKSTLPVSEIPVSDNNIPQINENVKLPIVSNNDMQNNENNTNKINLSTEKNPLGYIPKDPTKESSYDDANIEKIAKILDQKPSNENQKQNRIKELLTTKILDKGYYIDKIARQYKNPELSSKYDYQMLANGIGNQIIGNGRYDNKGNKIGKSLYEIFEPIENAGLVKEFSEFMYHQHNIDRMSLKSEVEADLLNFESENPILFSKERKSKLPSKVSEFYGNEIKRPYSEIVELSKGEITGDDEIDILIPMAQEYVKLKEIYDNTLDKPVFGKSITAEISRNKVKELLEKYPQFEKWANEVYEYSQADLQMLVDNQVISEQEKEYYNKKYPHYVPIVRAKDNVKINMETYGKKATVRTPIKTAQGGNADLIPLKDALAYRTMQSTKSALINDFGLELYKTINGDKFNGIEEDIDTILDDNKDASETLTPSTKNSNATFSVYKNGEKIVMNITDEIYEALTPRNLVNINGLNKLNNFRRGILTEYNPIFMITNPIKDIQDGLINSRRPLKFIKNIPEAFMQIKNKGEMYQLYIANGGGQDTYFNYDKGTNLTKTTNSKLPSSVNNVLEKINIPKKVLNKISSLNQFIEMTPRLSEFISSIDSGDTIQTAMYNSQEVTTNFKRGGDWTKNLDRNGFTFLNAGVQGFQKQIRNVQEARMNGIRGYASLGVKFAVNGLALGLLNGLIWGDDDDYEDLSDYIKNNYYIIGKYGSGKFLRIPKGRVTSVLQKFFNNLIDVSQGKDYDYEGLKDLIKNNLLPNNPEENNLISPLIQAMNNETWYGGELVPTRLQNLPNKEQYDETTDSISIWLGNKLNISPYKINYLLDQYSGAIGDFLLPYLTLQAESSSDSFGGQLLAPLKDKFTTDSVLKNQNVSDLYSLSEEYTKKSNSSFASDEDKLRNKYINSSKLEMSDLYAKKRNIQSDKTLNNSEKYNQSRYIQSQINKIAKDTLKTYQDSKVYSDYGKVNNQEYYLNSKKEWTKVKDEESIELNELNYTSKEKNEYFKTKVEIGTIRSNESLDSSVKHERINQLLINSSMNDEMKGHLYGKYYSSESKINAIIKAGINFNEFLKFNSQEFTTDYYSNGKAVPNSRKNKVIKYVNSLNLSIPQKALLIKMEYSSYKKYDKQIAEYVNSMNISFLDKASILKKAGFTSYDKQIINYVNKMNITKTEKEEILEEMGFTIRNGRVYS